MADREMLLDLAELVCTQGREIIALRKDIADLREIVASLNFQAVAFLDPAGRTPWAWAVVTVDRYRVMAASDPHVQPVGTATTYEEARAIVAMLNGRSDAGWV